MAFENLEAIVDFAIEGEKEAVEFYTELSAEAAFSGSAEMFKEFAREERKHQKLLEDFKAQGIAASIADYQLKWVADIKRSDYVVEMAYHKGMGYDDILLMAMKREEKALKLYNDFQEQADTEAGKTLFKILCQEEARHKQELETLYDDYMARMGD